MAGRTTDDRLDDLIRLMERNSGRSTSSSSSSSSSDKKADIGEAGLKTAVEQLIPSFSKAKEAVLETQDMYHSLSKAGMSFSGDLFAMGNAAVGMRMSTKELEDSFLNFQKDGILKGFGSNVTESAEKLAKASKHFFDNNTLAADGLRAMGYTTKDINEVIAMQGITLRGKFKDDQEMASVAAENAAKLGIEMDGLAKLTGKSRQEQVEMMKKQQADMQFEAAIRLKTQGMSAEEAAKFEANARQQLKDATILGQGQMFKEIFATGQIMTKEAATQAAMNREQAQAATNMAKTAADKTLDSAERERKGIEARNQLAAAATADLNNTTKLQAATLGEAGGTYGKVILDNMGKQIDYGRTIEKVALANGLDLKSKEDMKKATDIAMEEIRKTQEGRRKNEKGEYDQVDASSRALASFQGRIGDAASVVNEKFTQPIQGQVNKALQGLADTAFNAEGNLGGLIRKQAQGTTVSQKIKSEVETGEKVGFKDAQGFIASSAAAVKAAHETVNETIPKVKQLANDAADTLKEKAQTRTAPKRETGSLGMTGQLFENFGSGTLMELHGIETVMRPKDLAELSKNQMEGMLRAIPKSGVLDLDKMKKDAISFSTSAGKDKTSALPTMGDQTNEAGSEKKKEIDRKSLKFDQFGMPITKDIKYKPEEIANEVKKKEEQKSYGASVEEQKKGIAAGKPAAPEEKKSETAKATPAATGKDSSLSDVVASLNQLNSKVSQLIEVQKDIGQRQIKAVKANSKDVYNQ